jgi:hypothetical protein
MVEELVLCQLRRFNLKTKEAFIWMKSGLVLDGVTSINGDLCTLASEPLHVFNGLQGSGTSRFAPGILKNHQFLYT